MSGPRHVLVIGAQCPGLGLLDELDTAARSLHRTLTTPWAGACAQDPELGRTLLHGPGLTRERVEKEVRRAGHAAADAGAVLVLAFLGHGMAAGTQLHYMAEDSRPEDPLSAVDLGSLLGALLDTTGLDGLVALVDTCHAGNALPDLPSLANGIRRGDTRLSLLMAAGADEEAYALRFSTTVVKVLEAGVSDAGETLTGAVVAQAVRRDGGALGQNVHWADYDGAAFATAPLWLARNARHAMRGASMLGSLGRSELARALGPLTPEGSDGTGAGRRAVPGAERTARAPGPVPPGSALPGAQGGGAPGSGEPGPVGPGPGPYPFPSLSLADTVAHPRDLEALRARLPELAGAERRWAAGVLDALRDAVRTLALLEAWPGADLTTALLRRTLAAVATGTGSVAGAAGYGAGAGFGAGFGPASADPLPDSTGTDLLRDAVEHLLLRAPRAGRSRTAPLAAFVARLARDTDVDPQNPVLRAWAKDTGAVIDLNDAFAGLARHTTELRLRLVVSLHSAIGDEWPETLEAWLLDGGTVRHREEFPCPAQDRTGTERTLLGVLRWAGRLARALDAPLRRVEIAAPAPLLATWRPEEADIGRRLGTLYDVVLRWSDRIQPPDHLFWINDHARGILKTLEESPDGSRVDWLGEGDTRRAPELRARLMDAPPTRALALAHRPAQLTGLMETLLASSPIVMWPDQDPEAPPAPAAVRRSVDAHWHQLPGAFCHAYRERWSARPAGGGQPPAPDGPGALHHLAGLRTVWDGTEWLDFCTWFEQYERYERYEQFAYEDQDVGPGVAPPGPRRPTDREEHA
ncbi:hypothetical protein [Streptomyces sp. NPDC048623]|uniref:vWA-MoxR associated conflict system protein n=1 Tax=Streptomyces sp. NPDC048623 TaxID=3155761 RepID=UPI0034466AE3